MRTETFDTKRTEGYASSVPCNQGIGFSSPRIAAKSRKAICRAAFSRLVLPSLWAGWMGSRKARRCYPGLLTRPVPPTRLAAGVRFSQLTGDSAMSTSTPVIFNFKTTPVRTVVIDGHVWFVASDIAKALDYAEAKDMTRVIDADEQGRRIVPTPSGDQEMLVVNEAGLYHAVLKSRKPEAKPFRKWVTSEVLPAIRKTGSYTALPGKPSPPTDPALLAARDAALRYFDAFRANPRKAQIDEIPAEVLRGFAAAELLRQRFVLAFDQTTGAPRLTPLAPDAWIGTQPQLLNAIRHAGGFSRSEVLALFAACTQRLLGDAA